jgi:hypothetical protein
MEVNNQLHATADLPPEKQQPLSFVEEPGYTSDTISTFWRRGNLLKKPVFWDVLQCGSCNNRRFGGTYRFHYQGDLISEL